MKGHDPLKTSKSNVAFNIVALLALALLIAGSLATGVYAYLASH